MSQYKVTACWYETVIVDADDEDAAVDEAREMLTSEIRRNGYVDDYDVEEIGE